MNKKLSKKNILKDNHGMTMAEVLMGFVILLVLVGSLSGIIAFSHNMYLNCVDAKKAQEAFQAAVYKNKASEKAEKLSDDNLTFTVYLSADAKKDGMGNIIGYENSQKKSFDISLYKLKSKDLISEEADKSLDMEFYYFADKK